MKKFILILVMLITGLTINSLNAQGSWTLQNNPTTEEGESMQFVSATEGWIGLNSNKLLHTTNSGLTWDIVMPTGDSIGGMDAPGSRISFVDASTGWVMKSFADTNGNFLGTNLYKTINGGLTWNRTVLSTAAGDAGIQVQFVDVNNGWLLIYNMDTGTPTFLKTTDGGASWTPTNGAGIFYYVNATTGYAFSAGPSMLPPYTIFKTIDGGANWAPQKDDNTAGELNAIHFTDANNGWVVGNNGKIFKTTDGSTWTQITNSGYNSNYSHNAVSFINNTTGWIGSQNNTNGTHFTLSTTDGGSTWSTQELPFYYRVYSMDFWDAYNGWATSASYNNNNNNGIDYPGQIVKYSTLTGTYSNGTLNGPWFFYTEPLNPYDDQLNYAFFDGNGNITGSSGFPAPVSGNYAVNSNGSFTGIATMGGVSYPFSGQLTSQNGGTINFGDGVNTLSRIPNPGALQDKIVGELSTQNFGKRNVTLNIDVQGKIISASGLTPPVSGNVYADLGVFLGHLTTGEAVPWNELSIMGYYSGNELYGKVVLDSSGDQSFNYVQLVRYNNPPENTDWKLQTNPAEATTEVGKIQFVTATEGWISISPGGLLHTTDGGTTWARKRLNPTDVICSLIDPAINMCFISPSTGWVIKTLGTDVFFDSHGAVVYKTTDGGYNWQRTVLSQVDGDMGGQIQFIDANNGYVTVYNSVSGLGKYFKTADGGTTWNEVPTDGKIAILYQVDLNDTWGISGVVSDIPPYSILHSSNGMTSFTNQLTDNSSGKFIAIQFSDLNHGWVVGEKGKILKTDNGGTNWNVITNTGITSDYTCKSVYFMNATTGWIGAQIDNSSNKIASTNYAIVLHTTDGGTSWTTQTIPTFNPYSIFFWDANTGWLTSDDNKIAHFSNALSIKENVANKFITIYPNPNNGTFYFSLEEANSKVKAEIYTLTGQKVFEASNFEMQPQNEVNFAPQSKGIYIIKINDGENSYSEKVLIQ